MDDTKKNVGRPAMPPDQRADSQIQLRVTRKRKAAYVRRAQSQKKTLAAWMFGLGDADSGYKGD